MRTTVGPSGAYYHHNSDYSGDIQVDTSTVPGEGGWSTAVLINIPFEDMKHLVLEHYRSKWTGVLEMADGAVLERLLINLPPERK